MFVFECEKFLFKYEWKDVSNVFCMFIVWIILFQHINAGFNSFIIWYVGVEAFDVYCDEDNIGVYTVNFKE